MNQTNVKEVPLTQGKVALIDVEDWERVSRYSWHIMKGDGGLLYAYAQIRIDGKRKHRALHRFILNMIHSPRPFLDHKNRDGLDCRKDNLRIATNSQNLTNIRMPARNTSGYKGVMRNNDSKSRPWWAQIRKDRKSYYLGAFSTAIEAALAYDDAAKRLHGEFATLNFPITALERAADSGEGGDDG